MNSLAGRRILVTRASGQASVLAALLEAEGAIPILIPTIELAPPASWCAFDAALTTLLTFDWLLFTSANAVHVFAERARLLNRPAHARRIAVIGPATAAAVRDTGLAAKVDLMPQQYVAEAFAQALLPHAPGARMLLVRAAIARDILPETLAAAGATVTLVKAYRSLVPPESIAALRTLFTSAPPDAITFTSASTARNLATLLDAGGLELPQKIVLASIGPITSTAMQELNLTPTIEAEAATLPALVAALRKEFPA